MGKDKKRKKKFGMSQKALVFKEALSSNQTLEEILSARMKEGYNIDKDEIQELIHIDTALLEMMMAQTRVFNKHFNKSEKMEDSSSDKYSELLKEHKALVRQLSKINNLIN